MTKSPLVSIIVLSYNHDKFIDKAIKSVINQAYKNIELIVIDDGASNFSIKIISELAKTNRFKFYKQPNCGLCATINKGIFQYSSGEYIALLASDDFLSLNRISDQVDYLEKNREIGMVFSKSKCVNEFDIEIGRKIEKAKYFKKNLFNDLILGPFIDAQTAFVRRSVYDFVGKYDDNLKIEDYDMWLRIARHYQIGFINKYHAFYRSHGSNTYHKKILWI